MPSSKRSGAAAATAERPFVITRELDAPRDLVFKAFTEAERLMHWWGPKGFTNHAAMMDLRPGGVFHYGMRAADGGDMWGKWTFREVKAPERLSFVAVFSDPAGGTTRHPMAPEWPRETLSTITFTERAGKTAVTVEWTPINATDAERRAFEAGRESMQQGWTGTLDQFEAYLADARQKQRAATVPSISGRAETAAEVVFARLLDAPRERVFQAWTDPELLSRWWGPDGFTSVECALDLRAGGAYRIAMRGPDGVVYPLKGVYREVAAPERLAFTADMSEHPEEWHALVDPDREKGASRPALEMLWTVSFEALDGKTLLVVRTRFESAAIRAAMMRLELAEAMGESMERLIALLRTA